MEKITICAIDPGVTTGYCLCEYLIADKELVILEKGHSNGIEGAHYLASLPAHVWVIERFTLIMHMARGVAVHDPQLMTVQVIGALKALLDHRLTHFQTPSEKQGCPDSELRALNLWQAGDSDHTRDALRHCVVFSRRKVNVNVINQIKKVSLSGSFTNR